MAIGENLTKKENVSEPDSMVEANSSDDSPNQENVSLNKRLIQYCVFKAGEEEYAIPIDLIKEVVKYNKPAPLPQVPDYILGMTNIRGNIYGIMDLELFFQVRTEPADHNYLLVLDHDTFRMSVGIENVPDSLIIEEDMVEELKSSTFKTTVSQKYLKGVIKQDKRMIILFDIIGIISSEKFTTSN